MKGEVVYLYAFDVANEIETSRVAEILKRKPFPFEIRRDRTLPKDLPIYKPLAIEPTTPQTTMNGQAMRLLVRVYDVGVVSVAMRVSFEVKTLAELMPFHCPTLDDGTSLDELAREMSKDVCESLGEFLIRKSDFPVTPEAYTAFCLTSVDGVTDATRWLESQRREVAGLLTETSADRLSESQIVEVLRVQQSFENTDMVVMDWDAALVMDLTGYVDDVLYALELANVQIEEFRVMDHRLDQYLDRAYDDLAQRRVPLFGGADRMLRSLRHFRVDVTKLHDEVTHITKFFGDWYLARVYLGARERFHLDQWRNSVEDRLAQLDQLYTVFHSEINEYRMLWLEIIIVIFFAIDLIAIFWLKG